VPEEHHRRVQQVGVEGEDETARTGDATPLREDGDHVRHVMQHAAEGHHIERTVGEGEARGIGLEPARCRMLDRRDAQRSERQVEAGVAARLGLVDLSGLTGSAADVEDVEPTGATAGPLEAVSQRAPAAGRERVEISRVLDHTIEVVTFGPRFGTIAHRRSYSVPPGLIYFFAEPRCFAF
jgi:hypothetical protein